MPLLLGEHLATVEMMLGDSSPPPSLCHQGMPLFMLPASFPCVRGTIPPAHGRDPAPEHRMMAREKSMTT